MGTVLRLAMTKGPTDSGFTPPDPGKTIRAALNVARDLLDPHPDRTAHSEARELIELAHVELDALFPPVK